jgi:flavin prenyltransferase
LDESSLKDKHIALAITGASGAVYGMKALELLSEIPYIKVHLIITKAAFIVLEKEIPDFKKENLIYPNVEIYNNENIGSKIASGSFDLDGMLIAPCTLHTACSIGGGLGNNLVLRVSQVCLKEKKNLVLLVRETPLGALHLEILHKLSLNGAVVMPASPSFYFEKKSIDSLTEQLVKRALSFFNIPQLEAKQWNGL